MLSIKVRYFAMLRETKGLSEEWVECAQGTTVGHLFEQLFPAQKASGMQVGFAVNLSQVQPNRILANEDEVAFLPPLGGG